MDVKPGGYTKANAPYYNNGSYTKYTTDGNTLEAADDAANKILGGDWQLPTKETWKALYDANTKTVNWGSNGNMALETIGGIQGMKISKNDGSNTYIFLPADGIVGETSFVNVGSLGHYWSGTAAPNDGARSLGFSSNVSYFYATYNSNRHGGFSVRPVRLVEVSAAATTEGYNVENDFEW